MAKTAPADAVKAKLEAEEAAAKQENTVEVDEADLDAADAAEKGSPDVATIPAEFDLSEDPVSQDPELAAKRAAAFKRAEEFEKLRAESRDRKATMLAGATFPAKIPEGHIGGGGEIPEIFYRYAAAFPHTTPDEHILCGYASIKLTVGDFRRLVGLPTRS